MSHATLATIPAQTAPTDIENIIMNADGVIIEDTGNPGAWFAVTLALEKYGKPVALIADGASAAFGTSLNHPMLKIIAPTDDRAAVDAFFTKHFPAPVDPDCGGDVCRI
ncbi:hypothetical protein FJZ55_08245 [Candidatus Woesearchaeota archaeon]|nr:hypothetical protein [Candidatus Woesearchaeota archaeon]